VILIRRPCGTDTCFELLKTYSPPEKELALPILQPLPRTPTKAIRAEFMFSEFENKILEPLSSATKPKVQALIKGTKEILTYSQLQEQELQVVQARRVEELQRKVNKRKVIQKVSIIIILLSRTNFTSMEALQSVMLRLK
jgi:hypothetical protein